jgi:ABC-type branched-subunit amino acid transport system permease subunit
MRKRFPWKCYAGAGLFPALAVFMSIGLDQSLCEFSRARDACLRETSLQSAWWKILLAALLGCVAACLVRNFTARRRQMTLFPRY